MVKRFPLQKFFKASQVDWANLPEHRKPSPNTRYALSDAVNSTMSMFFMQSQSFLAYHQAMSQMDLAAVVPSGGTGVVPNQSEDATDCPGWACAGLFS
jgi:hypothetical protein